MNSVELIGRLTRDPEVRYTSGSNMAVATFTIAIDRPTKAGEDKQTDFPRILDRLAAYFEKHPEGKAWGMSAVETAEMILLTEDDYDEVESDETVSDELLSE